ncbi:MAG TPA: 4-alpha-glucanotransferase, partial [Alphaproteobacteria bacterium]|nr:4-alpha-glucanotransferase [Alphaproteobacteria bacterium]
MDRDALHRLAAACGLQVRHTGPDGEVRVATEAAVRGMLAAMKVDATSDAAIARSLASAPPLVDPAIEVPRGVRCHLPSWLISKPAWGVTCQLYGLRSGRNHGIGDFEDLAVLAERLAPEGADFIGINPIHALFTADPDRCSPFSPSNRKFLNPLFIALDRVPGIDASFASGNLQRRPSSSGHINYRAVARIKLRVLRDIWKRIGADSRLWAASDRKAFEAFVAAEGEALHRHAVFEALSHVQTQRGRGAGWHGWPPGLRRVDTEEVARFAAENEQDVRFHLWLQWVADRQVADAAARARAAGMRIGLYLDLAVGAAPDGSATWSDPDLVMTGATIGAPPDGFFTGGQNWGLAPMSPLTLRSRRLKPYREMLARAARHAGAVR